ncbi:MAG TPA: carboxylating nicotinate-nucleotide diphosphorylase [Pyrinomonadaceae bacterium]|nr:carboxylating nicotinate-nucleotide diphosphorylase [Pyrinomonadaceae bacterium]
MPVVSASIISVKSTTMVIKPQLIPDVSPEIEDCIQRALAEDLGPGDATTNAIISPSLKIHGEIVAKQAGVIAGLDVAARVFFALDETIVFETNVGEGEYVANATVVAKLYGPARALLTAERTALNFLGRMSGIATLTRQFVDKVAGTSAKILDTRKTAPGLRLLDKLAVLRGGGKNHRQGLFDMILIKDNHIAAAGSLAQAVQCVRDSGTNLEIEIEAANLQDLEVAIALGVQRILLDNMSLEMMTEAVKLTAKRAQLEASGNVSLETVASIAATGVDFISVGALTHSAKVFDVSLKFDEIEPAPGR